MPRIGGEDSGIARGSRRRKPERAPAPARPSIVPMESAMTPSPAKARRRRLRRRGRPGGGVAAHENHKCDDCAMTHFLHGIADGVWWVHVRPDKCGRAPIQGGRTAFAGRVGPMRVLTIVLYYSTRVHINMQFHCWLYLHTSRAIVLKNDARIFIGMCFEANVK